MLFNSYEFILAFMPITLIIFSILCSVSKKKFVFAWILFVSLFSYSLWGMSHLVILFFSTGLNWVFAEIIHRQIDIIDDTGKSNSNNKVTVIVAITFNILLLGYFKYANFLIDTLSGIGVNINHIENIFLPLGISFYTFEQISYLVGIAKNDSKNYSYPRFLAFVAFFPHLVAGPILNANELIPQFRNINYRIDFRNIAIGLTIFSFGLFKKVVIADSISGYATPIFTAADGGTQITFLLAWQAAIAYTLQLYFDFSGYSDMAIGLAKLINIKLPINFFSPYKAIGVGDFWRRWHISLGRFLRDYIYIPMGGSRKGNVRTYLNLFLTMLIGGLWHGASWTFIFWGALHGVYLCIDRWWGIFLKKRDIVLNSTYHQFFARMLTLLAVINSWVIFRAQSFSGAFNILFGMFGLNGVTFPQELSNSLGTLKSLGVKFETLNGYAGMTGSLLLFVVLLSTLYLPNVYQFMVKEPVALDFYSHLSKQKNTWYAWKPSLGYSVLSFIILTISLAFCSKPSEFLYFQF
jgi:alginate O-acetyltransferase complex protein AlgI